MISFENVTLHGARYGEVGRLYREAFPKNERVPLWYLAWKARTDKSELLAVCDGDRLVGMVCNVYHRDIAYVWYLAVAADARGNGFGSAILGELVKRCAGRRVILNIETRPQTEEEREVQASRKRFYLKNGFRECGVLTQEKDVAYEMLCAGESVSYPEYAETMRSYMGRFLFRSFCKEI